MNEIFPQVRTVLLADATPGSILRIPRYEGPVLALTTDQVIEGHRSIVMLNAQIANLPRVVFAQKWRLTDPYLCYGGRIRFEFGMGEDEVDDDGHDWRQTPGVVVSIGDNVFIRAAPSEFGSRNAFVNICTGAIFADKVPNSIFSFGSWKLCLRDDASKSIIELCNFKAPKRKS